MRPYDTMSFHRRDLAVFRQSAIHRHTPADGAIWYYGDGHRVLACCYKSRRGEAWAQWRYPEAPKGLYAGAYTDYFLPEEMLPSEDKE